MKDSDLIIGIDTSNYTTSVSLVTLGGELLASIKRPLPVKEGEHGLRQSDALFHHVKNLPLNMEELRSVLAGRCPVAVGVSSRPRNIEGSYMPCFLAGVAAAESISAALSIPIYRFSHQCGHIMAALYSSGSEELLLRSFAALHLSGGTTELVLVNAEGGEFVTELVGGTKDLNAGQAIDRVGVFLGMPFPAGAHMEKAALENKKRIPKRKVSTDGTYMNLSGLENMAMRLYRETGDIPLTSAFVLDQIGESVRSISRALIDKVGDIPFVFAGGVMSNSLIKEKLKGAFDARFAEPSLSADNAVGTALLARRELLKQK